MSNGKTNVTDSGGSKDKDKWIIVISYSNSNFNIKTSTFTATYDDEIGTTTNRIQTYNSMTTDFTIIVVSILKGCLIAVSRNILFWDD